MNMHAVAVFRPVGRFLGFPCHTASADCENAPVEAFRAFQTWGNCHAHLDAQKIGLTGKNNKNITLLPYYLIIYEWRTWN